MIGKLIATGIKIVTLPVDAAGAALDIATGGRGDKRSRMDGINPFGELENLRDQVAEAAESIDD